MLKSGLPDVFSFAVHCVDIPAPAIEHLLAGVNRVNPLLVRVGNVD